MKFLVVLAAAVAVACAAAVDVAPYVITEDHLAPILKSSYDLSPEGNFHYEYETGNGINAEASGVVKDPLSDTPSIEVRGYYRYTAPDGTPIDTSYLAGVNGFVATGSHIPSVPEEIARSIAYNAARTPAV